MPPRVWSLFVVLSLAACSGSQSAPQSACNDGPSSRSASSGKDSAGMMGGGMMGGGMMGGGMMDMKEMCPVAVPGTTAHAEDVENAAALAFTTTGDVAEVRRRVARMAEMHNHRQPSTGGKPSGSGMMGGGMMGGGMMGGGMMGPPSQARAEDIEGGARLIFTPNKAEDLQALRDQVKQHAENMAAHKCPMMGDHKTAEVEPAK